MLNAEKIDIIFRDVTAMYRDLGNLENSKMDKQQTTNQFTDLKKNYDKLYTEISLKENHIVTIENFIEKYLPVRILSQISEVLKSIYRKDDIDILNRLNVYEKDKYY